MATEHVKLPAQEVPIVAKVDVLVVGSGAAGFTAAVCVAHEGVDILLVERYGYLGGLADGALVIDMDNTAYNASVLTLGATPNPTLLV